ncbi:EF-hand [Lichtheimia hyalospora FSU 10163]|nr:EF-hand [Lichtheimia hyalospora FSU 10163]
MPPTTIRVPATVYVASGVVTGILAISAAIYFFSQSGRSLSNDLAHGPPLEPRRSTRLRRSRNVRRRRSRSGQQRREGEQVVSPLQILSDAEDDLNWSDDDSKNLLQLVYTISENQARKEGYIHRGITCNKCRVTPIRGIRYKCANCVDFDLCELCESANCHLTTHVFLKIRIPIPPLANPRSALLPAFYPGNDENSRWILKPETIRELQDISHFDQLELEALYEQFKSLATVTKGDKGGIDNETFEQCLGPLGLEKNLITERIFAFFDQDRDGIICFKELVCGLSVLSKGNLDEKIEYAFRGYDLDNDGYISRDELYRMFKSYFYLSMELVRDVVSAMEDEMMDNFEFSASQPVSAAFNIGIPSSSSSQQHSNSSSENEEDGPGSTSRHRRRYPHKEAHFEHQYAHGDGSTMTTTVDESHLKNKQRQTFNSSNPVVQPPPPPKKTWEEKFPIMETMSQDAINEMVDKTFKSINVKRDGYISLEEFKQCVQADSSIVSWFESLGSVF